MILFIKKGGNKMEEVKSILKDTKKTAIIGLCASVIILIMSYMSIRSHGILYSIINILTPFGFAYYYAIVCLKLYKNMGNVIVARNILLFVFVLRNSFKFSF